jgi:hypothetical protein
MSRGIALLLAGIALLVFAGGCVPPRPKLVVTNPDPTVKIPAIKKAVDEHNLAATRQMVKDLESEDPAVRFYAVEGLRKMTGEDYGYNWFDEDDDARRPAVKKWQEWLRANEPKPAPTK